MWKTRVTTLIVGDICSTRPHKLSGSSAPDRCNSKLLILVELPVIFKDRRKIKLRGRNLAPQVPSRFPSLPG